MTATTNTTTAAATTPAISSTGSPVSGAVNKVNTKKATVLICFNEIKH